jgi:cytochrome d ubiquinol oxidase subunit II
MTIETLWLFLVAFLLAMYTVLDGFDLGVGGLHLWLGRSDEERRLTLRSIGPVWNGNEVWLLAGGGSLYCAFPGLYASGFSGFYLALTMVLWLLIFRGIAVEFRNHYRHPRWRRFWDTAFGFSSLLLALFLGVALGNVIRGVPLDANGWFFTPLFTDFRVGPKPGILDWYTVLVGLFGVAALLHHGALWLALKTRDDMELRARKAARTLWWPVLAFAGAVMVATVYVQPQMAGNLARHPWGIVFPLAALGALAGSGLRCRQGRETGAFVFSALFLGAFLLSVVCGIYPMVLPSSSGPDLALTVQNTAAAKHSLAVALAWWIPGMLLVGGYFTYTYRSFAGKIHPGEDAE